jgi:hypothetical protein
MIRKAIMVVFVLQVGIPFVPFALSTEDTLVTRAAGCSEVANNSKKYQVLEVYDHEVEPDRKGLVFFFK